VSKMDEAQSYYNSKSKSYDEIFDTLYFKIYDAITWKYLEPYVPTDPNALVLDAGGGTGRWAVRMAKKGCKVVLMDVSEGMVKVAAKKVKEEGLQHRIIIKKGDTTKTGYPDETFDMILCEHTLFIFKEPDMLIKELRRVLKKKARLIISAQNRYVQSLAHLPEAPSPDKLNEAFSILTCKKYNSMMPNGKVKIYTLTPEEFRTLLERDGFRVEKIVGKGVTMPLRISREVFTKKEFSKELFDKILRFELALCDRQDALALAGHLHAIAYKP